MLDDHTGAKLCGFDDITHKFGAAAGGRKLPEAFWLISEIPARRAKATAALPP
jgi:hypothetical protein